MLAAAGRALAHPGISRSSVFGSGHRNVFAYSLAPQDPTRFIREAAGKLQMPLINANRLTMSILLEATEVKPLTEKPGVSYVDKNYG